VIPRGYLCSAIVFELRVPLPDVVAMQTRQPNLEGAGEIPLRRLVKEALRMRPSRIVVGEVRQEECLDLTHYNSTHTGCGRSAHRGSSAAPAPPAGSSPAPAADLEYLVGVARRPTGRHESHGLLGDRKHGGVGDRVGHSRTSVRLDICGRTSLLPRSCAPTGHLAPRRVP
jgi:hypothetical protein